MLADGAHSIGPTAGVRHASASLLRPPIWHPPSLLTVPACPNTPFPSHVTTIAPAGDARSHTFDVAVQPDQQDGRLLPGMFAQVSIQARENAAAVLVPRSAVVQGDQGASTVFVVADGVAHARQVEEGASNAENVEIVGGVAVGELVVVTGQTDLRDGQPVATAPHPGP